MINMSYNIRFFSQPGVYQDFFVPSVSQGGVAATPPLEIARMLTDFYHLWLIRSGSMSSRGGTKKNFGFWSFLTVMTS